MRLRTQLAAAALMFASAAWPHDSAHACEPAAAKEPSIEGARLELKAKPRALNVRLSLADKLIAIGCHDEAVKVLEEGFTLHGAERSLQARLRTAQSYIGEREFLKTQPAPAVIANEATLARLQVRCKQLGDLPSCDQAIATRPSDAGLWAAKGDVLLKEKRAQEALAAFNRAKQVSTAYPQEAVDVAARLQSAQALLVTQRPPSIAAPATRVAAAPVRPASEVQRVASAPAASAPRRYSNSAPPGQSH